MLNRDESRLKGKCHTQLGGFFKTLQNAESANSGVLSDGDRLWNMGETKAACEFSSRTRVLDLPGQQTVGS